MEDNNIIATETEQENLQQQTHEYDQNGKNDLFDRTIKGLEMANRSADTGLRVFSALSDHAAKKDAQFVAAYRSPITRQRKALIADAVRKNEITRMQGFKELSDIQKQEEAETLRLLDACGKMKKASGEKNLKTGIGVCVGGSGISIVIWTLFKIFGKKAVA